MNLDYELRIIELFGYGLVKNSNKLFIVVDQYKNNIGQIKIDSDIKCRIVSDLINFDSKRALNEEKSCYSFYIENNNNLCKVNMDIGKNSYIYLNINDDKTYFFKTNNKDFSVGKVNKKESETVSYKVIMSNDKEIGKYYMINLDTDIKWSMVYSQNGINNTYPITKYVFSAPYYKNENRFSFDISQAIKSNVTGKRIYNEVSTTIDNVFNSNNIIEKLINQKEISKELILLSSSSKEISKVKKKIYASN